MVEFRFMDAYKNQRCNDCGRICKFFVEFLFKYKSSASVRLCPECFLRFNETIESAPGYYELKTICVEKVKKGGN